MPLSPVDRLGHYDVTALIGEGGIGEKLPAPSSFTGGTRSSRPCCCGLSLGRALLP